MPGLLLSSLPNYSIWKISFGWTVPENGFLKQKVIRYPYSLAISAEKWRYQAVFAYTRPTNRSWHVLPGDVNLFQIIVRYRRALPYVAYHEWTSTQRPTNQWHMRYAGVRFRSRWRLQFRLWFEWKSTYLDACTVLLSSGIARKKVVLQDKQRTLGRTLNEGSSYSLNDVSISLTPKQRGGYYSCLLNWRYTTHRGWKTCSTLKERNEIARL